MTAVAVAGIVVNIAAAWVLAKANRQSLNIEGSFQHLVTDLYAFIGTFVAGVVIISTGFNRADAIASLIVALLMLRSGYHLQRKAVRVLLEGVLEGTDPSDIGLAMAHAEQVVEVHDLHVWELSTGPSDSHRARPRRAGRGLSCYPPQRSSACCSERFHIEHTTLQVDHAQERLLSIQRHGRPQGR